MILPAALPAAHEILASLDYTVMDIEPWPNFYKRYRQVSEFNRRSKDGFTFLVDLHWGIVDIPFYKRIPIEGWFNRAKLARCGQAVLKVPAPEDQLLCLCSQWGLHERYAFSLMRFCDVSLLLKRASDSMDWARLIRQNIDWRLLIPVQRALNQVEELWPDTVPAPVLKEITASPPTNGERRIHRWVIDRPQNATSDVLLLLATTPGPENKVRFLLEQAFPSPDYMRARYNPKSSRLWPLLYLWRFFLGLLYLFRSS